MLDILDYYVLLRITVINKDYQTQNFKVALYQYQVKSA